MLKKSEDLAIYGFAVLSELLIIAAIFIPFVDIGGKSIYIFEFFDMYVNGSEDFYMIFIGLFAICVLTLLILIFLRAGRFYTLIGCICSWSVGSLWMCILACGAGLLIENGEPIWLNAGIIVWCIGSALCMVSVMQCGRIGIGKGRDDDNGQDMDHEDTSSEGLPV